MNVKLVAPGDTKQIVTDLPGAIERERTRPACLLSRPGEVLNPLTFPQPNSPERSVGWGVRRDAEHCTRDACAPHLHLNRPA